jgi:Ca2+ transporting ATPase
MHEDMACGRAPPRRAAAEKGVYQRVGEATEVALRVLAEKVGLPGYAGMPGALGGLPAQDRATFCNDHWQRELHKVRSIFEQQPQ